MEFEFSEKTGTCTTVLNATEICCARLAVLTALRAAATTSMVMERAEATLCLDFLLISQFAVNLPLEFAIEDVELLHGYLSGFKPLLPQELQQAAGKLTNELQVNLDRIYGIDE